jgi:hypothetical protein
MLARVIVLLVVVVCVSAFQVARPMVASARTGSVALFAADIASAMVKTLRDKHDELQEGPRRDRW